MPTATAKTTNQLTGAQARALRGIVQAESVLELRHVMSSDVPVFMALERRGLIGLRCTCIGSRTWQAWPTADGLRLAGDLTK